MPELPEVEALRVFLAGHAVGRVVAGVDVIAVSVLKTYDPVIGSIGGLTVTGVARHGQFLALDVDGLHLVMHLARTGWLRWRPRSSGTRTRPGQGALALRLRLDDGSGFDLTEAGTRKSMGVHLVRSPDQVPGIAELGPDALSEDFDADALALVLRARRTRLKGVLCDQTLMAGIGDAYSDEILHAAGLSPFVLADSLSGQQVRALHTALRATLADAVQRMCGLDAADLTREKRGGTRVHGRTGEPCPVCQDTVREVSYTGSVLHYCPTCQTGGRPLADRRLSRLLK